MKLLVVSAFVVLALQGSLAKVFQSDCEYAAEISKHVDIISIPDMICLAKSGSNYNTSKVTGPKDDNSYDYGIFQINSKYCTKGQAGGSCNIDCNKLTDDDITDDMTCFQRISYQEGFNAWSAWVTNCAGQNLILPDCPRDTYSPKVILN